MLLLKEVELCIYLPTVTLVWQGFWQDSDCLFLWPHPLFAFPGPKLLYRLIQSNPSSFKGGTAKVSVWDLFWALTGSSKLSLFLSFSSQAKSLSLGSGAGSGDSDTLMSELHLHFRSWVLIRREEEEKMDSSFQSSWAASPRVQISPYRPGQGWSGPQYSQQCHTQDRGFILWVGAGQKKVAPLLSHSFSKFSLSNR